ncbi:hypothetical protein EW146_g5393 [Bondarzewia mesenterica]|uniref:Uncharacterized protein n=1 Tax=Bondarzewia mesenterica TaxID=1095465 RepID=A0A4S4LRQ9_9AGAM|nr:hypothetical protein EW146_g5393 [Bondarzewia mesenterica]
MADDQDQYDLDSGAEDDHAEDIDLEVLQSELKAIHMPNIVATVEEYQEVIRNTQLLARSLLEKLRNAQITIVSLHAEQSSGGGRRRWRKGAQESMTEEEEDISKFGRQFFVIKEMWVEPSIFLQPAPRMPADSEDRYKAPLSIKQGVIADLYSLIPTHLHDMMQNHSSFGKVFQKALSSQCSTIVHRLRLNALKIFGNNNFSAKWFEVNYDRGAVPELQALLKADTSSPRAPYSALPPIFFPNEKIDKRNMFKSKVLILHITLFSQNSVSVDGSIKALNGGGPHTLAHLWGVTSTTPGGIAFAATMACFLLSPDTKLTKEGERSHIRYYEDFNFYKKLFIKGRNQTTIKNLFKYFDQTVFTMSASTGDASRDGGSFDDLDASALLEGIEEDSDASFISDTDGILSALNDVHIAADDLGMAITPSNSYPPASTSADTATGIAQPFAVATENA